MLLLLSITTIRKGLYTRDKVEFDTVDFVDSRKSRPYRFGLVHTGDNVERTFDIRATKITHFRQSRRS